MTLGTTGGRSDREDTDVVLKSSKGPNIEDNILDRSRLLGSVGSIASTVLATRLVFVITSSVENNGANVHLLLLHLQSSRFELVGKLLHSSLLVNFIIWIITGDAV